MFRGAEEFRDACGDARWARPYYARGARVSLTGWPTTDLTAPSGDALGRADCSKPGPAGRIDHGRRDLLPGDAATPRTTAARSTRGCARLARSRRWSTTSRGCGSTVRWPTGFRIRRLTRRLRRLRRLRRARRDAARSAVHQAAARGRLVLHGRRCRSALLGGFVRPARRPPLVLVPADLGGGFGAAGVVLLSLGGNRVPAHARTASTKTASRSGPASTGGRCRTFRGRACSTPMSSQGPLERQARARASRDLHGRHRTLESRTARSRASARARRSAIICCRDETADVV